MKKKTQHTVLCIANIIELFIAILIIVVTFILSIDLIRFIVDIVINKPEGDLFVDFLERALTLVIGLEFVRLLCNHKPGTLIEVLLFAIARQMIVEHTAVYGIFIGVISMAVLFIIRKFLFIDEDL